ncbi:uncharacterized protein LOC133477298 [Phyllopteryx taeniolatus]|uniref:uncharacterized protein LOC133477298 n=1 Tax=Phyllopteryx taeniolatus TaxID=161469 RepID=UPI002AD31A2C|nr:uncharacterized protein LOC133477298 [Phyllopteryx taeniolatus]
MSLACGDIVRLIRACCISVHQSDDILTRSGLNNVKPEILFAPFAPIVFAVIRDMFPSSSPTVPKLPDFKPLMDPSSHFENCTSIWTDKTGSHPSHLREANVIYRIALLDTLAVEVGTELIKDPDLMEGEDSYFNRHVSHHLKLFVDRQHKSSDEVKDMQEQLLKLQLAQARKLATDNKQEEKMDRKLEAEKQMWMAQGSTRRRDGSRDRGFTNGGRGGGRRPPPDQACFNCGQYGHWYRQCTVFPMIQQQPSVEPGEATPQRGGYKAPRGRGGRGPAPWQQHPQQAPPQQQPFRQYYCEEDWSNWQ